MKLGLFGVIGFSPHLGDFPGLAEADVIDSGQLLAVSG